MVSKQIKDFPDYAVTDNGEVHNTRTGTTMTIRSVNDWRALVLSVAGKQKLVYVHDLVAEAFLPPRPATAERYFNRDNELVTPENCGIAWLLTYKDRNLGHVSADNLEWQLAGSHPCQVWMHMRHKRPNVSDLPRRPCRNFPSYDIDTNGTVYRRGKNGLMALKTFTEEAGGRGERIRKAVQFPHQYVMLRPTLEGEGLKTVKRYVADLLGEVFLKKLGDKERYWFKNGDPTDCRLENLCVIKGPLWMEIYQKVWLDKTHNWAYETGFKLRFSPE